MNTQLPNGPPNPAGKPTILSRIPYRGWESHIALPMQHDLDSLGSQMIPYAFLPFSSPDMVLGGVVQPGETAYGSCTQEDDCWITHLTGSITNPASPGAAGNFTAQFYDSERQQLWTQVPLQFGSVMGSAQKPFYLRRLYLLPSEGELKVGVVNLATFAAVIQIVAWGLRRDTWKAVS